MIRFDALRKYRREYFHALRNGLPSTDAANQAMTRVKEWALQTSKDDNLDEHTAEERWGAILAVLIEWQALLRGTPIDKSRISELPRKDEPIE